MIINTNMASLNTLRQLGINEKNTQSALAKLSSGLRINTAADDAAGLAISEKMRGQIAGLNKATSNAQDGISLVSTAEGSLNETTSILQRMRELAVQGSNDTNTTSDRTAIQTEMNQLTSEINRIGNTTEFNTQKLLKGTNAAAVTTAQTTNTNVDGVTGIAAGATDAMVVNAKSVVAIASTGSVQGNTAAATGKVGSTDITTASVKGATASTTLQGLTFTSITKNDKSVNGVTVKINQLANATGIGSSVDITGSGATAVINFNIGTGTDGKSLFTGSNRGELSNYLTSITGGSGYAGSGVTIAPPGAGSAEKLVGMSDATKVAAASTISSSSLSGGITEVKGVSTFSITSAIKEAGDTINVGGKTFTAVAGTADASKGEFNVDKTAAAVVAGAGAAATTDVSAATGNQIDIAIGGTTYTLNNTAITGYGDGVGKTNADVATLIGSAANGTAKLSDVANVTVDTSGKINITAKTAGSAVAAPVVSVTGSAASTLTGFAVSANVGTAGTDPDLGSAAVVAAAGDRTIATDMTGVTTDGQIDIAFGVTTYTIDHTALSGYGDGSSAAASDLTDLFDNASDGGTGKLSDVANVTISGNKVTITAKTNALLGAAPTVTVSGTSSTETDSITALTGFALGSTPGTDGTDIDAGTAGVVAAASDRVSATNTGATLAGNENIKINLGGTDYNVDHNALAAYDGSVKDDAALIALIGAAKTAGNVALSTVANVTIASNKLTITDKTNNAAHGVPTVTLSGTNAANLATLTGFAAPVTGTAGTDTSSAAEQAKNLLMAINADTDLSKHFSATVANGKITMTEKTNQATGTALSTVTTAGAGANDKLDITDTSGKNLSQITIVKGSLAAGTAAVTSAVDSMTLTSGTKSTELNGIKLSFSGLTSGTSTSLTSSWDAAAQTLNITGSIADAETDANFGAAVLATAKTGLTDAGFQGGAALTLTPGTAGTGAGGSATLIATAMNGNSMTFSGGVKDVVADTLTVDQKDGNLTIYLANTTASNNTAAKIQTAVQALGTVKTANGDVDFSKYQFKAEGNWDTKATGEDIVKANTTLVGGTTEVKGDYSFDIAKAFDVGDLVNVKGQIFTAVAGNAVGSKNEFDVSGGDIDNQAISLRNAISLNSTLSATYNVSGTGANVDLKEITATGTDLKTTDLAVKGTGTAGQYAVDVSSLMTNGASFELDGQKISVSNKAANVGYANGTAIKVAATVADQTKALADAINTNATLKVNYTASVDSTSGNLVLTQTAFGASSTAPQVSTTTSTSGDFIAKLQIGANTGQTMTLDVADMRSVALGISGDGTASTVAAQNGTIASYVATANVSNGTDNTNVEFALDISTADKATAAISVIDDATAAVSAERSKLGAYQNRLEHTINNLGTSSQNITTAEANIRDVDMAKEMTNFQKNNILQQAAQAMLAQANQQPQGVLQLLR